MIRTCYLCGDILPSNDYPYHACHECMSLDYTSLDDCDPSLAEFDSVEDMIQQSLNEELGLE